jgi:hypothetical protein
MNIVDQTRLNKKNQAYLNELTLLGKSPKPMTCITVVLAKFWCFFSNVCHWEICVPQCLYVYSKAHTLKSTLRFINVHNLTTNTISIITINIKKP